MKEKKININGLRELLLVGVVLLLCVVWTVMNPQFLSLNNITNILRQASYTAIAAVGMTMIIIIGEIDLSAGSLGLRSRSCWCSCMQKYKQCFSGCNRSSDCWSTGRSL